MTINASSLPALIVVDVQKGIDEAEHWGGNRNNPQAEENIMKLLSYWSQCRFPVFIVQHASSSKESPFFPGKDGYHLKDEIADYESRRVIKLTANAFINTSLEEDLIRQEITEVYIAGFITNNSVEATARMSGDLGFKTTVIHDATATFDKRGIEGTVYSSELIHQISLANLEKEYATIKSTHQVIEELDSVVKS